MSNRVTIQPTKFTNVRTGHDTFGFRAYDNYGQACENTWDEIPDDDMDFLRKVMESDNEALSDMIENENSNQAGIYIGEKWYDYEGIKHIISEKVGA